MARNTAFGETSGTPAPRSTILLIEDEEAIRQLVTRFLTLNGYHVLAAENSAGARRLWDRHKDTIELLLTDLLLPPGLSGRAIAREFRTENRELKVLYTSGHNLEATANDECSGGQINFLPKPFRPDQLLAAVRAVLAGQLTPDFGIYAEDSPS